MAEIIPLAERRAARPPSGRAALGPTGEIVLFLGVRYERHEEGPSPAPAKPLAPGRGRRARRRA
jgi:hypothetical protein